MVRSRILTGDAGSSGVGSREDCERWGEKSQTQNPPGRPESVEEVFSGDIFSCCRLPGPALPHLLSHTDCFTLSRTDPAAGARLLSEGSDVPPWAVTVGFSELHPH